MINAADEIDKIIFKGWTVSYEQQNRVEKEMNEEIKRKIIKAYNNILAELVKNIVIGY